MLLAAAFALSIRPDDQGLDYNQLKMRRRGLLFLMTGASALLVIGVLAQKTLMEWPLSLIAQQQSEGLKPLANALSLQVGAMGSLAMIGIFVPAVTAWQLDADRFEMLGLKPGLSDDRQGDRSEKLVFAPISTVTSLVAVLAPLLASPFIDALKSILVAIGGK